MKLTKALKLKNKLAGEIANIERLIHDSNVTEGDNAPAHDVVALYEEQAAKRSQLVALKGKIAIANGPIAARIHELAETKGLMHFLRGLDTKQGKFQSGGSLREPVTREYHATLTARWVEDEARQLSERIERLQDEIDEHNATTTI